MAMSEAELGGQVWLAARRCHEVVVVGATRVIHRRDDGGASGSRFGKSLKDFLLAAEQATEDFMEADLTVRCLGVCLSAAVLAIPKVTKRQVLGHDEGGNEIDPEKWWCLGVCNPLRSTCNKESSKFCA